MSNTKTIIGYRVIADCTLEYSNYEVGEEIILPSAADDYECPNNWPGTILFETHPYEFEPIYEGEELKKEYE